MRCAESLLPSLPRTARRVRRLVLVAVAGLLATPSLSQAALQKYAPRITRHTHASNTSPTIFFSPGTDTGGVVLFDETVSPPVLRLLDLTSGTSPGGGQTVPVPQLSGFIFVNRHFTEGPAENQTAVSSVPGDRIDWGTVTGWTTSGQNWCNSEPATVCILAGDNDEATTQTQNASPFYDIGTWFFHGTGFTSIGFIWSRFTTGNPGDNAAYILRGAFSPDGTVPALPVAGVVLLGASTLLAGFLAARRRR